jgi:hypothetical protein
MRCVSSFPPRLFFGWTVNVQVTALCRLHENKNQFAFSFQVLAFSMAHTTRPSSPSEPPASSRNPMAATPSPANGVHCSRTKSFLQKHPDGKQLLAKMLFRKTFTPH